jgi:hypothetical protein
MPRSRKSLKFKEYFTHRTLTLKPELSKVKCIDDVNVCKSMLQKKFIFYDAFKLISKVTCNFRNRCAIILRNLIPLVSEPCRQKRHCNIHRKCICWRWRDSNKSRNSNFLDSHELVVYCCGKAYSKIL